MEAILYQEEWKPVNGTDGYEISNLGRIKRIAGTLTTKDGRSYFVDEHMLKPQNNQKGYFSVTIRRFGKYKKQYIHRLVAESFIPNPQTKPYVNHIDNNPANNRVDNLEWCTQKENMQWCFSQGRNHDLEQWQKMMQEKVYPKRYRPVVGTSISTGEELYFDCIRDVATKGFKAKDVSGVLSGKAKTHFGHTWRYA